MSVVRLSAALLFTAAAPALAQPAPAGEAASLDGTALAMLDPIVVTGVRDGYDAKSVVSATKTDTPLRDVPQAVSVITAEQIADQGLQSIGDVLRVVPGAAVASGEGHRDQILLRGQNSTADFFVDGLRDDVQYYRGLYNLDRVEVLKGPNAMIFGRGGGGGVVNRVTKKAADRRFANARLGVDSEGAVQASADLNSPLGGTVVGRLNASAESFESFRDHVDGRRYGLAATLGAEVGAATRIDLDYEYSNDRRTVDRGLPSNGAGGPLTGQWTRFVGDEDVNRLRLDAHVATLSATTDLSDRLRWVAKARFADFDKYYANALAATALQANGTIGVEAYDSGTTRRSALVQNDLVAKLGDGPVRHTLLAGIDVSFQHSRATRTQGYFDGNGGVTRLFVPLESSDALPAITFRDGSRARTDGESDATALGLYVQDQLHLGDHVELIAGLRRDIFTLDYKDNRSPTRLSHTDRLWSPRAGLVVKPRADVSLYASWSKSFLPQSGDQFASLTPSTAALDPERFINREVGIKWGAAPRLEFALAAYVLDRDNSRATDASGNVVLTGEQRSKGLEASVHGKLAPRLSVAAAAALQKAVYRTSSTLGAAGNDVPSVPRFTGSLWARYDVSKSLGFGLGAYRQSSIFASATNAVRVPGFTRLDAAAFVGLAEGVGLQLNLENLADKRYIGLVHNDNNLTPAAPRTLRAALRVSL